MHLRHFSISLVMLAGLGAASSSAFAQAGTNGAWVGTWAAAPFAQPNKDSAFAKETTLRQIVHVSVGGSAVRIVLTNEFGTSDLKIGGAAIALPVAPTASASAATESTTASATSTQPGNAQPGNTQPSSAIQPASTVPVLFGGQPAITIAPGAIAVSDPVSLRLAPQSDLAITLFIPGQTVETVTYHGFADQTNFQADGNQLTAASFESAQPVSSWRFLKGVDVQGNARGVIVCLGDSITDGALSKPNTNHRYPDVLAARLEANPATANLGVLNEGIGGNRVLHDGTGPSALARFDRDVLAQAGVQYVILLEGINDIGRLAAPKLPGDAISADDLIAAYKQLITRAHLHGIKIIGATLTPYQGAKYESETGEAVRDKVNDFIRNSGEFDAVLDFSKATADPANPKHFSETANSGDNLHPNDAGYKAMADSIDLKLFAQ